MPSPWNVGDALMVTAIYLKKNGGTSNEREAACKYYAGPGNSCSTNSGIGRYGDQVMGKKLSLEKQIEDSIKKGEIK
jgi:membrane-bound lytic murein transglycosylase B